MMTTNVQLLFQDLDHLLKDICDYLSNQINDANLTDNQRLFANKLIERSKKQLQQISKVSVTLSTDVDDSSYVDMNKQSAPEVEEPTYEDGENNEYLTPIDECSDLINCEDTIACPYELLPAADLDKCEKYGHLDKKGRFLFIGHQRRFFAGVKNSWLLLYCTKKDVKPFENLNLMHFTAKPTEGVRTKTFELICSKSQKAIQFVAQTPKDMLQWVACINKRTVTKIEQDILNGGEAVEEENLYEPVKHNDEPDNDSNNKTLKKSKPLPPLPPPNPQNTYIVRRVPEAPLLDMESYDSICVPDTAKTAPEEENIDEIYDVIQEQNPVESKKLRKPPPPEPEPLRNPYLTEGQGDSSVTASDEENIEETYDVVHEQHIVNRKELRKPLPPEPPRHPRLSEIQPDSSSRDSFSEDEEDAIYDVLVQKPVAQLARKPRPPDPKPEEPEEEYSNLKEYQQDVEPEEEYCNLATLQSQNKIVEQPEEEYSNLITVDTNKRTLPKPPLLQRSTKQAVVDKQKDDEEEAYDCVVSASNPISSRNEQPKGRLDLQKFKLKPAPPTILPRPAYLRKK